MATPGYLAGGSHPSKNVLCRPQPTLWGSLTNQEFRLNLLHCTESLFVNNPNTRNRLWLSAAWLLWMWWVQVAGFTCLPRRQRKDRAVLLPMLAPQHPPGEMEARPLSQMFPDTRSEPELTLISLLQNAVNEYIQQPSVCASEGKGGWWVQELNKLSRKRRPTSGGV